MKLYERKYWMRKSCPGWTSGLKALMYALAGSVVLAAPSAWAHIDPPGSSASGISVTMTAFRNDGTTPVLPGSLNSCETIQYRAVLAWAGQGNAAFEGGSWSITTPDGVVHDVTPPTGVPCIGGTFDDPDSVTNGDRGLCFGSASSIDSRLVTYMVSPGDVISGSVTARTDYIDAWSHIDTADSFGVGGNTPFPLNVGECDDSDFCNGVETCDPAATDGTILGQCVTGTPVQCAAPGECFSEVCDEAVDACVRSNEIEGGICTDFPNSDQCIPDVCLSGVCAEDGDPGNVVVCDDEVCESCDPATGVCEADDPIPDMCLPMEPVPTLSAWGLVAMILTLLGLGGIVLRRRLLR